MMSSTFIGQMMQMIPHPGSTCTGTALAHYMYDYDPVIIAIMHHIQPVARLFQIWWLQ